MDGYTFCSRRQWRNKLWLLASIQTKGSAQKEKIETYNYAGKEDHHVRLIGDLLPRYVYWIKGENGKNIPMECLSFR